MATGLVASASWPTASRTRKVGGDAGAGGARKGCVACEHVREKKKKTKESCEVRLQMGQRAGASHRHRRLFGQVWRVKPVEPAGRISGSVATLMIRSHH